MTETPETIYLIPGESWDSPEGFCWSDCPAPGEGMDPAEAVKYIRADIIRERLFCRWPGCSDHNCIVTGKKTGMGTNGGCHCVQNASRTELNILAARLAAMMGGWKA
jgi:hypothetical protein